MKITKSTIARTVILALALFNQIMVATGHPVIDIENDTIEMLVTTAATVITAVIAWWKNNSFTEAALLGDVTMRSHRPKLREEKRLNIKEDN